MTGVNPARSILAALAVVLALTPLPAAAQNPLGLIKLPPGFKIELYARVPGARSMAVMDDWGVVLVGTRGENVFAIIDADKDGRSDKVVQVFRNLNVANGIAYKDGWFYVAEQHRIIRFSAPDLRTLAGADPQVLFRELPNNSWHGWRYARFGPDGKLYVAVGSPCNICETDGLEGTIIRISPEGGRPEIFASGVRNSVGFDFHPATGDLYFTDNGADDMGDDSPPDEFNHAPTKDLWFGFPYFGGGRDRTPDFKGAPLPRPATFPVIEFGAHVASLGISFYRGTQFPAEYRQDAFVAQHGSWNRSVPDGYRIARIRFNKQTHTAVAQETFADGWLQGGSAWGRPVDVKEMADGSLLVSDDRADTVYRITYTAP